MKVGFIGLGHMGGAIAMNLVKAGHDVTVWNRSPEKAAKLVAAGATLATSPANAAQGEVVMTMLADDKAEEAVVFGDDGILNAPALHVSQSTISVTLAERLTQAHKGCFISAPVFGRPAAAEAASLFVVAAGKPNLLEVAAPLLRNVGQRTFHLGETPSAANLMKLCGNFMVMSAINSMGEAMTLGEKGGIPPAAMLEILTESLFGAPVFKTYGEILVRARFQPAGFAAPLGLKDMTLASSAATTLETPMPFLSAIRNNLLTLIARHGPDIDWAGVALVTRENAGLTASPLKA
ncbi:NAD(P)-dependent oxidoreductase [Novosphingobium sp. AP12]|uniref:NAD(P)-dependent oxidoreductase n=1 Tax=Novosphingobium sp. AP12 TaxID=1144305 RepID=UPI000271F6C5|nr:NAD(P)-dependent oxidoreductase [Novosphingobium sp. AP12]EJL21273.1 beta-hydroxyacid dehydrogenase, 3-hydroxyisobutyrate dehydrogenase [Novosphingobium sp. AP12]